MSDKDLIDSVNSVFSNVNKLRIARYLQEKPGSHALEIANSLDLKANYVTQYLRTMKTNKVVSSKRNGFFIEYSLTSLGYRILSIG